MNENKEEIDMIYSRIFTLWSFKGTGKILTPGVSILVLLEEPLFKFRLAPFFL
jgi:hypothetical protein